MIIVIQDETSSPIHKNAETLERNETARGRHLNGTCNIASWVEKIWPFQVASVRLLLFYNKKNIQKVLILQRAWYSPHTTGTMIHGQVNCISIRTTSHIRNLATCCRAI